MWLGFGAAIALVVAFIGLRSKRRAEPPAFSFKAEVSSRTIEDSRPDNPRFASWEEALNRRITDDLLFWIEYSDIDGVVTEREIIPRMIKLTPRNSEVRIVATCLLRNAERDFLSGRIISCINRQTGRPLKDLGSYLRARY